MENDTTSPNDKGLHSKRRHSDSTKTLEDAFDRLSATEGLNPFTMQESEDISQLNPHNPPDDVFKVLSALLQTLDEAQQRVSSEQQDQREDPGFDESDS